MPDGHRRGGRVTRNGRTHYRRGTSIRRPRALLAVGAVCAGSALVGGTALVGHPFVLTGIVVGVAAVVVAPKLWRTHNQRIKGAARRASRRVQRKIRRRWQSHPNRQQVIRRTAMSTSAPKLDRSPATCHQTSHDQPELWGPSHHSGSRLLS